MKTLYKKELNYYFNNPIGYIIVILFAVFANFLFVKDIFLVGSSSMRPFFGIAPWLLMIFIPALAMRIFSEERRTNTSEILLTLPVSETQIVIAKFFALLSVILIGLALTLSLPISIYILTKVHPLEIEIGYFGTILTSSSFLAISIFFSNKTKNQIVAFLFSVLSLFILIMFSTEFFATTFPKFIQDAVIYFSPVYHLQNFVKGVIDLRSVFYFLSLTAIFMFLTVLDLKRRE